MSPTTFLRSAAATRRFLGKCATCVRPVAATLDIPGDTTKIRCPDCTGPVSVERVYGTETGMTCDDRCEGAIGPRCECACGGDNHGGRWSESGEALVSEIARYQADQARRAERAAKRQAAKEECERQAAATRLATYADTHPEVLSWLDANATADSFAADLLRYVEKHGELTERQEAAVLRNIDRAKRQARWDAEKAAKEAAATDVPGGRQTVEGIVLSVRVEPNPFGPGNVARMLLDCGTYRLYGTMPAALRDAQAGERVRFIATLEPSERGFGYYKRPAKAEQIPA